MSLISQFKSKWEDDSNESGEVDSEEELERKRKRLLKELKRNKT